MDLTREPKKAKQIIFDRCLNNNRYLKEGDSVKVRGTNKIGTIEEIVKELDKVAWENNRPYYIVVKIGDQEFLAHPSQLKRRSK